MGMSIVEETTGIGSTGFVTPLFSGGSGLIEPQDARKNAEINNKPTLFMFKH
jgi:hypothetical protein